MATKNGVVKKTVLSAYKNVRVAGINAIKIDEDDSLIGVVLTAGDDDIMLSMKKGKAIHVFMKKMRELSDEFREV